MPSISAIIITKNESANLEDCLRSLNGLADEIIVVDSGSTDNTVEIAKRYGAVVLETTDWPGFGPQKNRALDIASKEWVFSIDADERATPEMVAEIHNALKNPESTCYYSPRLSYYCGEFLKHGGWYPDDVYRLFKKGTARFSDDLVHERLVYSGTPKALKNHLIHYSYLRFEQVIAKVNAYSSAGAKQAFEAGKRSSLFSAITHGFWTFFRTYVIRKGFLDGKFGLAMAISAGHTTYYKYLKLWHLGIMEKRKK